MNPQTDLNRVADHCPNQYVFVLLYHRIGKVEAGNSAHRKHTVSERIFKSQLQLLRTVGKFVSLDDIYERHNLGRINFVVTFDDVPRSMLDVRKHLSRARIPYTICPCTSITTQGFGIRDKVYAILDRFSKRELYDFTIQAMPDVELGDFDKFNFYRFTKDTRFHPVKMENEVIEPLYERLELPESDVVDPQHLTWNDIRTIFLHDPFAIIANHSDRHWNYQAVTKEEIMLDVEAAENTFREELGFKPAWFSLPYGGISAPLMSDMNQILGQRGYRGILWNGGQFNVLPETAETPLNLLRIMMPSTMRANFRAFISQLKSFRRASNGFASVT